MKKLNYLSKSGKCFLLAVVVGFISCKAETESFANQQFEQDKVDLIEELQNFNHSLSVLYPSTRTSIEQEGFVPTDAASRGWITAGADLLGAGHGASMGARWGSFLGVRGAIIGGICVGIVEAVVASALAFNAYSASIHDDLSIDFDLLRKLSTEPTWVLYESMLNCPEVSSAFEEFSNEDFCVDTFLTENQLGELHNVIIKAICDKRFDVNSVPDFANMAMSEEMTAFVTLGKSKEFEQEFSHALNAIEQSVDPTKGIDFNKYALSGVQLSPLTREVLELFTNVYIQYPDSEATKYIIDNYTSVIDSSEVLSSNEKTEVNSAFSVATCSPVLWTEIYNEN